MPERFSARRVTASRWFDPGLAALLTGICLIELFGRPELSHSLRAAVLVIVLGATVAVRRTHPVAGACVQAAVLLATPNFDDNFLPDSGDALVAVVSYSCGAHASRNRGLAAVVALAVCQQLAMGFSEFPNYEVLFVTLAPWWVGSQVGRRRRLVAELAERTAQLEASRTPSPASRSAASGPGSRVSCTTSSPTTWQ
jgi:hypothetical protein